MRLLPYTDAGPSIAAPVKSRMASPWIWTPPTPAMSPEQVPHAEPLRVTGKTAVLLPPEFPLLTEPGWVVPSTTTAQLIAGSSLDGMIEYGGPGMLKLMPVARPQF